MALSSVSITTICNDNDHQSIFSTTTLPQTAHGDMWISDQQPCLNFRYRSSPAGYESDWHVAGDPTLIIISTGCIELELRDGTKKQFTAGEKFIARDFTPPGIEFNPNKHGHRARVIGKEEFSAVHIKLKKLNP